MDGDLFRAGKLRQDRGGDRIWIVGLPRLPKGRHVIHVDSQSLLHRTQLPCREGPHGLRDLVTTSATSFAYWSLRGRSGPSTRMRTLGSVPENLTRIRPESPSADSTARIALTTSGSSPSSRRCLTSTFI